MSAVNNLLDSPEGLKIQEMEERKRWFLITAKVAARDAAVLLDRDHPDYRNGQRLASIAIDLHLHREVLEKHVPRRGYHFHKTRHGKRKRVDFLIEPRDYEKLLEMAGVMDLTSEEFIRESAAHIAQSIRDFRRDHGESVEKRGMAHA